MSAIRSPAVRAPAHDDREKHARHRRADLIVVMARPPRILAPSDSRVSIGGLAERWDYVFEGWSNPRAWTILDARGRSPATSRRLSGPPKSPPNRHRESESGTFETCWRTSKMSAYRV